MRVGVSRAVKITVVTPTFNSITTIRQTIESVLAQSYKDWEHIVIDGGSTDSTLDLLRNYPHLVWISEKDNGHYHAMNKGLARATGEVIAILNSDDCYFPETLSEVATAFQKEPEWDGLFGDVVYVDGNGREIFRREEACYDYDVLRFGKVCYVIHPTLFLKRSTYDRVGDYRYEKYLNCCDVDLILRLGKMRCKIGHIPRALASYRLHEHGQSADRRVFENMRREYLAIRKEHGFPGGAFGRFLELSARAKRQLQKLIHRGKIDIVPGKWFLRKHMRQKTDFSSNIDLPEF